MNSIQVKLLKPLEYALDGEMVPAQFVDIKAPTAKHVHLTSILKSVFQSNAIDARNKFVKQGEDEEDSKEEADVTPEDAVNLMLMDADSVDRVMIAGKEIMSSGLFLIDGEVKMTKPLIDNLSIEDFEKLLGSFMVNFIVTSLLEK